MFWPKDEIAQNLEVSENLTINGEILNELRIQDNLIEINSDKEFISGYCGIRIWVSPTEYRDIVYRSTDGYVYVRDDLGATLFRITDTGDIIANNVITTGYFMDYGTLTLQCDFNNNGANDSIEFRNGADALLAKFYEDNTNFIYGTLQTDGEITTPSVKLGDSSDTTQDLIEFDLGLTPNYFFQYLKDFLGMANVASLGISGIPPTKMACFHIYANSPTFSALSRTSNSTSKLMLGYNNSATATTNLRSFVQIYNINTASEDILQSGIQIDTTYEEFDRKQINKTTGVIEKHCEIADGFCYFLGSASGIDINDAQDSVFKIKTEIAGDPAVLRVETNNVGTSAAFTDSRLSLRTVNDSYNDEWLLQSDDIDGQDTKFKIFHSNSQINLEIEPQNSEMKLTDSQATGVVTFTIDNINTTAPYTAIELTKSGVVKDSNNTDMRIYHTGNQLRFQKNSGSGYQDMFIIRDGANTNLLWYNAPAGTYQDVQYDTATNKLFYISSTLRDKEEIQDYDLNTKELFRNLRLRKYIRKNNEKRNFEIGFIAEEFEEALFNSQIEPDIFICRNQEQEITGWKNSLFPFLLFDRVMELEEENEILKTRMERLENRYDLIKSALILNGLLEDNEKVLEPSVSQTIIYDSENLMD